MVKWIVVGNRDGQAVVNWHGVVKAACVLSLIVFVISAGLNQLLGMNAIEPASFVLDLQFVTIMLVVGIRRELRKPPGSLPRLASRAV